MSYIGKSFKGRKVLSGNRYLIEKIVDADGTIYRKYAIVPTGKNVHFVTIGGRLEPISAIDYNVNTGRIIGYGMLTPYSSTALNDTHLKEISKALPPRMLSIINRAAKNEKERAHLTTEMARHLIHAVNRDVKAAKSRRKKAARAAWKERQKMMLLERSLVQKGWRPSW